MTSPIATLQENYLVATAHSERVYQDLIFFYAAQRELEKIDALGPELDPSNETDMLVLELFLGTDPQALLQLASADDAPWIRYSLLKACLHRGEPEKALAFWKKILQWQVPDTLCANTLLQYALQQGRFEEAGNIAAVSLKVAPKQRDVMLWKAMAQSKRPLDGDLYLDPRPKLFDVTLALTSKATTSDLAQSAEAIAAQNYPVAEVLLVTSPEGTHWPERLPLQPRALTRANGQSWIGAALDGCTTPLLITVPEGCVPTFDYVQQFLLATENAAPSWAAASGRMEDLNQDKPGDVWRVARMGREYPMERSTDAVAFDTAALCLDCATMKSLSTHDWTNVPSVASDLHAANYATSYLPEVVALNLREDTIESALVAYWQQDLSRRVAKGDFASASALLASFSESRERAVNFMNESIAEGSSTLIFPDFLHFFQTVSLDLREGVALALLDASAAGQIQDRLIESLAPFDEKFQRGLRAKVRKSLGTHLFACSPANALPLDIEGALAKVLKELDTLLRAFPQDLYLALIG